MDASKQGGDKATRLPTELVVFSYHCGERNRDVPAELGVTWAISCGGTPSEAEQVVQGKFSGWARPSKLAE